MSNDYSFTDYSFIYFLDFSHYWFSDYSLQLTAYVLSLSDLCFNFYCATISSAGLTQPVIVSVRASSATHL